MTISVETTRIISMIILFIVTYLVGIVPLYIINRFLKRNTSNILQTNNECNDDNKHTLSSNSYIQIMLQFGGGVLFATIFTHLIPDINENFEIYLKSNQSIFNGNENENHHRIPYVELAICGGFFAIFLSEELIHLCLNRFHKHRNEYCCERDIMNRCQDVFTLSHETNLDNMDDNQTIVANNSNSTGLLSQTFNNYGTEFTNQSTVKCCQHNDSMVGSTNSKSLVCNKQEVGNQSPEPITASLLRGFVIIFAFSVHSIFDGLSIGLQETTSEIWSVFFAITTHKLVIAFVVSMELYDQSKRLVIVAFHMALFSMMSPIGILLVILTEKAMIGPESESSPIVILLISISTGTLLYIVFYEILQKSRCGRLSGLVQFISVFVGFGLMFTINILISA